MDSNRIKRAKRVASLSSRSALVFFLLTMSAFGQGKVLSTHIDSYEALLKAFQNPAAEFRPAPLWVWNDQITRAEIDEQMADFHARGIGGVFIHPRPGLITPYLTDEWFSLFRHAVDVGKKLGMKIWIYDENSYPSGFAGGHVPAQMPDAGRTGLRMLRATDLPKQLGPDTIVVLEKKSSGFVDITSQLHNRTSAGGDYYIFTLNHQQPSKWYGGFTYVDLMRRDVTEKFLDVTLNAYKRIAGDQFGTTVLGSFQDEAEISPAGGRDMVVVNYTPALFEVFKEKWGYDLRIHLPSLYDDVGEWQKIRHDFYATLLFLFIENWAKPYFNYCTENKLVLTGHYWEHEWPRPRVNPDNMAFAAYAGMPGIDILMNDFQTDVHAQFGNARAVKEIRSVANQLGKERTMSETFGAGGWDMTFFDQKRIADWEYVLGVNFLNQHLSYVTIKGARKRDHPLSFSYHEPWWQAYNTLADYYGRLSATLSSGEQVNRIAVLEPTTTGWMYYSATGESDKMRSLGKRFQDFVHRLEAAQVEYDLASEAIIKDNGKAQDGRFIIGQRGYKLLILPPAIENLEESTVAVLRNYLAQGGNVLCYGDPPACVSGRGTAEIKKLAAQYPKSWHSVQGDENLDGIKQLYPPQVFFQMKKSGPESRNLLFHHRRVFKDCELLFLANINPKDSAAGSISAPGRSCERWDVFSGKTSPYAYVLENDKLKIEYALPPGGSLMLCVRPVTGKPGRAIVNDWTELKPSKLTTIRRVGQNVLTLDYCDLTLDGKTERDLYFYEAQLKTYKHHGLDGNPWDNGVQYKTSILDKDHFAQDSGFEAAFEFVVEEGVNLSSLQLVVERPQLYQVSINGQKIEPIKDQWWLDKAFGRFDIGRLAKVGLNSILLKASPFTIHTELEPVYLLGDFALCSDQKGFKVAPSSDIKLGSWAAQGLPFYAAGVAYTNEFKKPPASKKNDRFLLRLGWWSGVVAEVQVNGKNAGYIGFAPFELDVTDYIVAGTNNVTVVVFGSLKNTLGPHHNEPPLGRAWPGSFQQGAKGGHPQGSKYSVVDYGLSEGFVLLISK